MIDIDKGYLGYALLQRSFRDWFLYCFRVINGTPFVVCPIHEELFEQIQKIIDGEDTRLNINLCPRTGKTTLAIWLTVYSLTINPKSQIIYTSYSQDLLAQVSKQVTAILTHPVYMAMYSNPINSMEQEEDPVDEFWKEYLLRTTGKPTYSTRKITTGQGGVVLFSAIGGQITGFGAGVRGAKGFSGLLIIDDGNKVSDSHSLKIMLKIQEYFVDTLFTRLNNSNTPIANIQQRVHIEDLSGFLSRVYKFKTFKFPLLAPDGSCNLPNQYTTERIEELKLNNSVFYAQYQQEPTAEKGMIIKRDWWKLYNPNETPVDGQLIVTADTAFKETKTADYSCLQVWELKKDKMLMRDMLIGKWEFPDLIQNAKMIWTKWDDRNKINRVKYFFIEDKASGTPLQQTLYNEDINAIAWQPGDYDYPSNKVARTKTLSWDVFRGFVYVPENNNMAEYLINEASLFTEDMSHTHDDSVDACSMAHSVWKFYGGGQD